MKHKKTPRNIFLSFWAKIVIPEDRDECWRWMASTTPNGYGKFGHGGKYSAHRFMWEWANKTNIPAGMCVLHKCDTTTCVNPYHLFLGTQLDNLGDMRLKKRDNAGRGERHGKAKLTEYQVHLIRRLSNEVGISRRVLGDLFGVSSVNVSQIMTGKIWRGSPPASST